MKKIVLIQLLFITMLLINSCLKGESAKNMINKRLDMLNRDSDDKKADYCMEKILEAIRDNDKNSLKGMFSKQALIEADDIDGRIDYLFEFIKGEVVSWKRYSGPNVSESIEYGHKTKKSRSFFNVDTDKQKYLAFIFDYTEDTNNAENVGLYALRVIKAEDEETQFESSQKMMIAGIYRPSAN